MARSLAFDLAYRFNGSVIGLEHRYYGEGSSIPTPDLTYENLKWLNADQALADTANFIQNNTQLQILNNSKWIVIGGSYAGNLAAWMRLKYPDLVYAAHSSSAPVNAVIDFWRYSYQNDVGLQKLSSKNCSNGWISAIKELDTLIKERGEIYVKERFGAHQSLEIGELAYGVSSLFATTVQYGPLYSQLTINNKTLTYVEAVCGGQYFPKFTNPQATSAELFSALGTLNDFY